MKIEVMLPDGRGFRLFGHPFRLNRWQGDRGYSRAGDGDRWHRIRMYECPLGVVHVTGKWGQG